ncbi:caspase drICE-like isoform X2 [Lycorma delicatula]|uniref:caspase drICE-like isoform X2 n=1 Tax=Lycorma delicatula TaxID=130591 RepID=UPI003F518B4D
METDGKPAEAVPNGEDVPDVLPTNLGHSGKNIDGIAKIPVVKEALFYNMDHKKRGVAIILNHEHFDIPNLKSRTGTAADCENLRTTLMSLGFEVRKYDDLTSSQIDHVLTLVSEEDHSDCDCILFALLSHGEQGMIYSKDSGYKSENLWSRFTADLCPTLAGKPKLFFIQACQGDKLDGGITVTTQVDSNSASPFKIPVHADFLIAYSTIPAMAENEMECEVSGNVENVSSDIITDYAEENFCASPINRNSLCYKMDHKRRGRAMIFNHLKFNSPQKKERKGTEYDIKTLMKTLIFLNFEVTIHDDLTYEQIDYYVTEVSKEDHSDCDCLLVVILTHGNEDFIEAKDRPYKFNDIWMKFSADKCQSLACKPKLFFLQACKGVKADDSVTVRYYNKPVSQTQADSVCTFTIPTLADFLIVSSTIHGFKAWRTKNKGSCFIQALCEELKEHCYNHDILTILTFVLKKVAVDYEIHGKADDQTKIWKQLPCFNSMLTRVLVFSKKDITPPSSQDDW